MVLLSRRFMAALDSIPRSPLQAFFVLFVLGMAIRIYVLIELVPIQWIAPHDRFEIEATAYALATTGSFADPYLLPTGPTAHNSPIWPGLMAAIYEVFGLTMTAGYVHWVIRFAAHAAILALLPWLGGHLGVGSRAGFVGGLLGLPAAPWPTYHEATTAIVMGLLLVGFLGRWRRMAREGPADRPRGVPLTHSALLGLAVGVSFHLQPTLLQLVLGCIAFELWWNRQPRRWLGPVVLLLAALAVCVPWGWRNYAQLGDVFFVRSNFGLELRIGHHEGGAACVEIHDRIGAYPHPRVDLEEVQRVQELGEARYMRTVGREARDWIRGHPAETARLAMSRMTHVWIGELHDARHLFWTSLLSLLALIGAWSVVPSMTKPQRAAVLLPLLTFPLVYYLVIYMPRYRVPIDWILLLLAGAAICRVAQRIRTGPSSFSSVRGTGLSKREPHVDL